MVSSNTLKGAARVLASLFQIRRLAPHRTVAKQEKQEIRNAAKQDDSREAGEIRPKTTLARVYEPGPKPLPP